MDRRFRQVDVFGEGPALGNPVAVVLDADGLDDEAMRRFSVWSNLSECRSLNAAAAEWLVSSGRASAPYVAAQGTSMGRRGRIHITAHGDKIWVGGRTDIILSGIADL